ncbi:hypothetical protein C4572_00270 [Candidatus Parcubacteria bacterium]|nr:MAG: hypothetical protein C4572_00270 [Candidatus Parcubacteria bacterium]
MAKYGKNARQTISRAMHKYGRGKLKSGKGRGKARSARQAVAIGISEARKKGQKVPPAPKRRSRKKTGR